MVTHALELLARSGEPRARSMFGGHGVYLDGIFVAVVADEVLYLKADASTQAQFSRVGGRPFAYEGKGVPMTMSYWTVPDEALDSPEAFAPWARLALHAALRARSATPASQPRVSAKAKPRSEPGPTANPKPAKPKP